MFGIYITVILSVAIYYIVFNLAPRLYKIWKIARALKPFLYVKPSLLTGHLSVHPGPVEEGLMLNLEWMKTYSCKVFTLHMGPLRPVLQVYHPEPAKLILKSTEPKPTKDIGGYSLFLPWIGEGLLLSNGLKWHRNRRLLTPGFHYEILKPYVNIYNSCSDVLINNIKQISSNGKSLEIFSKISLLTLDVILQCAFTYADDIQEGDNQYVDNVMSLSKLLVKRAFNPLVYNDKIYKLTSNGKTFFNNCELSHNVAKDVISKRRAALKEEGTDEKAKRYVDFLDILLLAKDEDGSGLTDGEIIDEVETFMFEGHDTTASGISWTLYNLARHPNYQKKVLDELKLIKRKNDHFSWEDLSKMNYLTMCIKESLRMHPPVHLISRQLTKSMEIENHMIPVDTIIDIAIWSIHHNPSVWGSDVMTYDPERFHPSKMSDMDPYAFIPFSAGPRNCIGQTFAMNEMKCTIANILYNFDITVDEKHKVEVILDVTLRAKDGAKLFLKTDINLAGASIIFKVYSVQ